MSGFSCFALLPAELRWEVWRFCLPRRVVELDIPTTRHPESPCELYSTSKRNAKPPAIAYVCREARQIAFENGGGLWDLPSHENERLGNRPYRLETSAFVENPWIRPGVDLVHSHIWNECDYEINEDTHRIVPSLLRRVEALGCRVSFMAELLHPFDRDTELPADNTISFLAPDRWAILALEAPLTGPKREYMVVLKIITLHISSDTARASGLFGLLGDAPVQLVDAIDVAAINEFFHVCVKSCWEEDPAAGGFFATACGAPEVFTTLVRGWQQDVLHEWERRSLVRASLANLQDKASNRLKPSMPNFRPMIMFRHCSWACSRREEYSSAESCWHLEHKEDDGLLGHLLSTKVQDIEE